MNYFFVGIMGWIYISRYEFKKIRTTSEISKNEKRTYMEDEIKTFRVHFLKFCLFATSIGRNWVSVSS